MVPGTQKHDTYEKSENASFGTCMLSSQESFSSKFLDYFGFNQIQPVITLVRISWDEKP